MAEFKNSGENMKDFKGVWVFCEQRQGELQSTVLELVSEGRKLADDLGVELAGRSAGRRSGRRPGKGNWRIWRRQGNSGR